MPPSFQRDIIRVYLVTVKKEIVRFFILMNIKVKAGAIISKVPSVFQNFQQA